MAKVRLRQRNIFWRAKNKEQRTKSKDQNAEAEIDAILKSPEGGFRGLYILRPCMIHGPGNKGNLNLLYNVVKRGIPYPLGAFENRRSFCSIDNLSFVINGLIENQVASGIYNVCDDETVSTNELIELISISLGKKSRIWHFSKSIIELAAKAGMVLHLPLNTERLQKLTENYVVSNNKIKKALAITQMPVQAGKGLERTLKSFE
jgi:nucleoside-diphosphate-sugar epimerase